MGGDRLKCPDCAEGIPLVGGNGKCSQCFGSGINLRLNSPDRQCEKCQGTGTCPTCQGSGVVRKVSFTEWLGRGVRARLALATGVLLFVFGLAYFAYAQRKYVPLATTATEVFHRRFSAGMDDEIYFYSDSAWSDRIDPETARRSFARIRRKMGACRYDGPRSWATNSTSKGTLVTLNYEAHCTNGPMREQFTWHIVGQKALLMSYTATGNLLLTD